VTASKPTGSLTPISVCHRARLRSPTWTTLACTAPPGRGGCRRSVTATSPPATWTTAPAPIAVIIRIVWELDGEMWLPGLATRWTRQIVYVEIDDARKRTTGIWVDAGDVRRM